ncbi:MAG: hypothetical protein AAF289_22340, partial [Cyanobacteria bacterium P01_A01_bin.135]
NTVKHLEENPEFAQDVERQVREKLELGVPVSATSVVPPDADENGSDANGSADTNGTLPLETPAEEAPAETTTTKRGRRKSTKSS